MNPQLNTLISFEGTLKTTVFTDTNSYEIIKFENNGNVGKAYSTTDTGTLVVE